MKSYTDMPHSIQVMLEEYCRQDPHGLRPSTLYSNIAGTLETNSVTVTAVLFDVSVSLVWMIKEEVGKMNAVKKEQRGLTKNPPPYII